MFRNINLPKIALYTLDIKWSFFSENSSEKRVSPYIWTPTNTPGTGSTFLNFYFYLFIYFWLCWIFIAARAFSLVAVLRLLIAVTSRCRAWTLGMQNSVVVVHGLSCSAACGVFPNQGLSPCLLHWQVNSLPLSHQRNPSTSLITVFWVTRHCLLKVHWPESVLLGGIYISHLINWT